MTDIEQARELLAAEYEKAGEKVFASRALSGRYDNDPDVRAIAAALRAAPEGFRLVPVEPTDSITADWVLGYLDTYAPEQSRDAIRNAFAEYTQLSDAGTQLGGRITGWSMTEGIEFSVFPRTPVFSMNRNLSGTTTI